MWLTTALLMIPAVGTGIALQSLETPLWVFQLMALLSGMGGGNFALDGRTAAGLVGGTGYNRPEDLEIQTANVSQRIYFTTTDSDANGNTADGRSRIYSFDVNTAEVKLFADASTIDLATGLAVGGGLRNADNLAIDANGNIRHHHFGEGGYAASERVIQKLLAEAGKANVADGTVSVSASGVVSQVVRGDCPLVGVNGKLYDFAAVEKVIY